MNDYSEDWKIIRSSLKKADDYRCQECGLQCLRPGERVVDLSLVQLGLEIEGIKDEAVEDRSEAYRRRLQTHHKDGIKSNNDWDNLINLCSACHLAEHRGDRQKSPPPGQLVLFYEKPL